MPIERYEEAIVDIFQKISNALLERRFINAKTGTDVRMAYCSRVKNVSSYLLQHGRYPCFEPASYIAMNIFIVKARERRMVPGTWQQSSQSLLDVLILLPLKIKEQLQTYRI